MNKLDEANDCYMILGEDGEPVVKIAKKLPNAWYLISACKMLMTANQTAQKNESDKEPVQ